MALTKEQKKEIVDKLKKVLKESETVAFVNFHGLGVSDVTKLRRSLGEEGVGYVVSKKTLTKLALSETGASGDVPDLEGELAIAYASTKSAQADQLAPARGVYEFSKSHGDKLTLLGGIFEGRFIGKEEMTALGQIPDLKTLRGMFVNIINSPIQRMAVALGQIATKKA